MESILKALILLVPFVSAQIQIEIVPGSNDKNPDVVVSGIDRAKSTDIDLRTFQLSESGVQENLSGMELVWKSIDEVNINHASTFGYKDLFITLKPISGRILRSNDKVLKYRKTISNNDKHPKTVRMVNQEVTETMTTKWKEIRDISVGNDIKHIVGFNRLIHSSKYGQEDFASRMVTLEAEPEDEVVLEKGEALRAELQVKETTLEVRIDYEVSLDGDIHFGYLCAKLITKYCLKHEHLDVNDYLKRVGVMPVLRPYEIVTFTYYHDPRVMVERI